MDSKIKIALFASGRGSNAINIAKYIRANCANLEIKCLVCNVQDAGVIDYIKEFDIPVVVIPSKGMDRLAHEELVLESIKSYEVDWILLAGYMRVLSESFLSKFSNTIISKIVNIHPSLLPLYPGTSAYEQAYENQDLYSGITIHLVDAGVDTGPIILQRKFPRMDSDSFDQFKRRGLSTEHELYREFLNYLNKGEQRITQLVDLTLKEKSNEELKSRSLSTELR
ncbi:phosphoribosylglycinamide formyltransferase [Halobacteriovorax marinus]|uniref:Phosphoribosylglycinamide formyltransferase n=1 Tax=Halobacteriovorax marinus TaxID=97084 RepID=A0A1Y5F984_9BACT|nr:phosphoribosylglycinamide formyltransferase [Halobacteriovorax marinus]